MKSLRILIGERDPFMRRTMESVLGGRFELTFAEDGESLLGAAREHPPDLVILEVLLPRKDGFQVCRELKHHPATAHIPVLVFSLLLAEERIRLAGADDFLPKPLQEAILLEHIEHLIASAQKKEK